MKVKFCGFTNLADVRAADDLGVDFVGFVAVASSPRAVTLEQARDLVAEVKKTKTVLVGDFEDVREVYDFVKPDYVQLHGEPRLELCGIVPTIQAFRGVPSREVLEKFLAVCDYVLLDKALGEEVGDFAAMRDLPLERVFVAGGLSKDVLPDLKPFAFDLARGIESAPGVKDHKLMKEFLNLIR